MTALTLYETARSALAEARRIDEVKEILDKAEALRAYGRMANDTTLEIDAAEIRLRAERRLGGLLAEEKRTGRLTSGRPVENGSSEQPLRVKLTDLGIDRKLSSRAQRTAGIAERAFEAMVTNMRTRMAEKGVRVSLDLGKTEDKQRRRAEREADLAAQQTALPDKRYGVILADPEWRFEVYSRETGMDRAADNHYPTSETEIIASRPVATIAADDCALFLWATAPMMPQALAVMAAWGFEYKSQAIWRKDRQGTGYWFRNEHELLLVGTRGKIPAPAMGTQFGSVFEAPVGEHSVKPDVAYAMIESYFPNLPKIELNARRGRPGWDVWGNEAPLPAHDLDTGEILDGEAEALAEGIDAGRHISESDSEDQATESSSKVIPVPREIPAFAEEEEPLDIPDFLRKGHPDNAWSDAQ